MKIAAIILAAGSSSRMGRSKQMLDIHGERLLIKTIQAVLDAGITNVVVVLGSDEAAHRKLIEHLPVNSVGNADWKSGMGSSIKRGLAYLAANHPAMEGAILSVCDQPLLSKEIIGNLIRRYKETQKPVVASAYSGAPGVPVLFHKSYFEKLAELPDDQGAKRIILQSRSDVSVVPFPGGEIDLDTMGDYDAFVRGTGPEGVP